MKNKTNRFLLVFVLMALGVICFDFSFNSKSVFAYSASITTDNSTVLNVSVNGTGTSIVEKSINVTSDCRNGYNLVVSTTESSDLYLNGNSSGTAAFTAVNGTSTLANSTNKWGYTLTSNPSSSTVFSPLSTTASTLKTPSETASPSSDINDTFPIYYGVKVDDTVSPGIYEMGNNGVIVYYLTMDTTCTQYTVSFNANGGTGTVANQNIQAGESTKLTTADTLTAPTGASYTDANNNTINGQADKLWTFWGWNTAIDGTGDWYKDKEAVEDLANAGSTITLYAQWKQATLADMTIATSGTKTITHSTMQDMDGAICYNTSITTKAELENAGKTGAVTLTDNRDGIIKYYDVSKLADGNCWMTTNLALGTTSEVTLTSDDTDLAEGTTFVLPAGDTTSSASYTAKRIRLMNSNGDSTNGTYYSWAAAVASTTSTSSNPTTSVCPKNWDLPTNDQYGALSTASSYSSSKPTTALPSQFLITGKFTNGATFYPSSDDYGFYWTSTSSSINAAYGVRVSSNGFTRNATTGTTYGNNKQYRKNIRCIASKGKVTINYDGNGTTEYPVTGSIASQINADIGNTNILSGMGFSRTDWTFDSWNTEPDGSGTSIAAESPIAALNLKPNDSITLYAQWNPQYTITYVNNCITYASTNADCIQSFSDETSTQKINLDANGNGSATLGAYNYNSWTLTGWKIASWTENANGTGGSYPTSGTYAVTGITSPASITLYARWGPVYAIQYDGNGADNPNGMGTTDASTGIKSVKQTNIGEGNSVMLLASNFKRSGYGFIGWSTDSNAWTHLTDNDDTNNPIIYGPMETISAPAYPNNGADTITMHAVWAPAETNGNNPVYLQNWEGCSSLTPTMFNSSTGKITVTKNSIVALTDQRDNEVYAIAKLADDNCWMIENLRLEHDGTVGNNINDNTVTNQSLSQGYGGTTGTYGRFIGLAEPETANFANLTTANSIYKSDGSSDLYNESTNTLEDIGATDAPYSRFPRYNNDNTKDLINGTNYTQDYTNVENPSSNGTYSEANLYSYGNYYTWAAAMANTNYYTSSSVSESAGTSICPSGWHLPSSNGTTKEYGTLSKSYGGTGGEQSHNTVAGPIMNNRFRTFPNNFILSGGFQSPSTALSYAFYRGSNGLYWSRSAYNNSRSYLLELVGKSGFYPSSNSANYSKSYGFSVRCLVDNTYTIQYDGNGADNPNGMGTTNGSGNKSVVQIDISDGTKVTLLASNFKRDGYGFAGWSTDPDAYTHFTDNDNTNDSIIYGPMEDVVIDSSTFNNSRITMYAVWAPAKKDSSNNTVYLQDFTNSDCNALTKADFNSTTGVITPGSVIALTDKRDNQVYTVAKLADDNCWMIENLRLEHAGTAGNNINDSSVTNQSLSQGYGGTVGTYGSFVGLADSESANFDNVTTSNSIYKSSAALPTDTYDSANNVLEDIGTSDTPQYRFPRYNSSNTQSLIDSTTYIQDYANVSSPTDTPSSNYYRTQNLYSYGNYYSWAAAMANTNNYVGSSDSEAANTSICPFNWHLPSSGTTTAEYGTLSRSYGGTGSNQTNASSFGDVMSNRFRSFPNNFLYSGSIGGKTFYDRGKEGTYWSRSSKASTDANILYFYSIYLGPSLPNTKYQGQSVRCLIGS